MAAENTLRFRYLKSKAVAIKMERVERQKQHVKKILCVMLPESVLPRLEASEFQFSKVTDRIPNAVCIFVDFFYGQKIMKEFRPEEAFEIMNGAFMQFDELLKEFPEFEKLKTLSTKALLFCRLDLTDTESFGKRLTDFLRDTYNFMSQESESRARSNFPRCVKIGVAHGPVVAGIVGQEKFTYDVYGDTCNVASRMQNLEIGEIIVTESTYTIMAEETQSQYVDLGIHSVKGRGSMRVYKLQITNDALHRRPNAAVKNAHRRASNVGESQTAIVLNLFGSSVRLDRILEDSKPKLSGSKTVGESNANSRTIDNERFSVSGRNDHESQNSVTVGRKETECDTKAISSSRTKVQRKRIGDRYMSLAEGLDDDFESIMVSFAKYRRQDGFDANLRKLLNRYTLYFNSDELEARFQLYARPWLARTISFHHQIGFLGGVAIFGVDCVLNRLFFTEAGSASLVVSGTYVILAAFLWFMRLQWKKKYRKVEVSKSRTGDHDLPRYTPSPKMESSTVLGNIDALKRFNSWLVRLFSEGNKGYFISTFTTTLYLAMMIYLSPMSDLPHATEALIYIGIIYVGALDSTTVSFFETEASLVLCTLGLTLEMVLLGKAGMPAVSRILAGTLIVGAATYVHIVQAKAGFITQNVLDYSQRQLDKETLLKAILPERIIIKLLSDAPSSSLVETFPPELLINILNDVFTEFDQICAFHGIEKIQTIGDAYIAASMGNEENKDGVKAPESAHSTSPIADSALWTCLAALDMQRTMCGFQIRGIFADLPTNNMQVRIGVHSGTAMGAMTGGQSKIKYELIGEAIDTAEKVQSLGEPGKVMISEKTKEVLVGLVANGTERFEMLPSDKVVETAREGNNGVSVERLRCYLLQSRDELS
ncbi:hypothetical protein HDV05_005158 [Chytridiales sp. JEL 0842]|nr:hypothetical protein HDV05_005158 [Chytridiales sp. JEL 0842]